MTETLTEEELIEEMKDCYSIFDRVGDMKVDYNRIADVLRSLGLNPLTADVNKCLKDSELEGTRVDFETFYAIYKQLSKVPAAVSYDDLVEGLGTMDREQCGVVRYAELKLILMNIGDKMTEDEFDLIVTPHEDQSKNVVYRDMIRKVMSA